MRPQEPREPDIGLPEDWEQIEKALGFTDRDPARRDRLWRELRLIWMLYLGSGDISPDIRPSDVWMALIPYPAD